MLLIQIYQKILKYDIFQKKILTIFYAKIHYKIHYMG